MHKQSVLMTKLFFFFFFFLHFVNLNYVIKYKNCGFYAYNIKKCRLQTFPYSCLCHRQAINGHYDFVCFEVLRPSQHYGVISNAVTDIITPDITIPVLAEISVQAVSHDCRRSMLTKKCLLFIDAWLHLTYFGTMYVSLNIPNFIVVYVDFMISETRF